MSLVAQVRFVDHAGSIPKALDLAQDLLGDMADIQILEG